jgi:signal transduction histidine kinase
MDPSTVWPAGESGGASRPSSIERSSSPKIENRQHALSDYGLRVVAPADSGRLKNVRSAMAPELRNTGIDVVGRIPWGTHFFHFYETKEDLLYTLIPYFKAGLEDAELCVWVVSEPLTESDAWSALRREVPEIDRYVSHRSIEIFDSREWYLKGGTFDLRRATTSWNEKLDQALTKGYAGMRGSGDAAWLSRRDWQSFIEYERRRNEAISNQLMTVLCTYPLATNGAAEFLDVAEAHQVVIAKRRAKWQVVDTPHLRLPSSHVEGPHRKHEQRIAELTGKLEGASEALKNEIVARNRVEAELLVLSAELAAELTAMSRLHEFSMRLLVNTALQPILEEVLSATIELQSADFGNVQLYDPDTGTSKIVAQRGFRQDVLDSVSRVHEDSAAGGRALQRQERVIIEDVQIDPGFEPHRLVAASAGFTEVIREALVLICPEVMRHRIEIREWLAEDLPPVLGARVELQQVVLNLMINGIEAMANVSDRNRELVIRSERHELDDGPGVLVTVRDAGIGITEERLDRLFDAFYTTKRDGLGMGLAISRSIIEAHGGGLWAAANAGHGATFQFVLPAEGTQMA